VAVTAHHFPNRFKRDEKAIYYSFVKMADGWKIEAVVPKRVSPDDRLRIVNWLRDYKSQVQKIHPSWVTRFSPMERGYTLHIVPTGSARELFEKGQNLKDIWTDEIVNRG
jgi:hypothetical protein